LNPSQCIRPAYRACSILMQRSATTVNPPSSAICIPSGLITPNRHHNADAPEKLCDKIVREP